MKRQNNIIETKLFEEKNKLVEKELESVTRKIEKRILDETQVSCKLPKRKIKVTNGNETAHDSESNEKSEVKQVDVEMKKRSKILQRRRWTSAISYLQF
ncbi:unnamed protein product [Rhizophagus irregularis]|nr:unnamed protein product [Rhizophagus irregularis]